MRAEDHQRGQRARTVIGDEQGIRWGSDDDQVSVELTGRATELLLALVRRSDRSTGAVTLRGDESNWARWLENTPL